MVKPVADMIANELSNKWVEQADDNDKEKALAKNEPTQTKKECDLVKEDVNKKEASAKNNADQPNGKQYKIKPGDTLSEIAKRNGVTLAEILESNPQITNPDLIKVGAKLILPPSNKDNAPPVSKATYTKPANDNPCTSGKSMCYEETFWPEVSQDLNQRISFNEFSDKVANQLNIDKHDESAQDYLKETYQAYLNKGTIEVSNFGIHAHEVG